MGYLHIDNLYKNQDILMFKECFALEKIHGTSSHVSFKEGELRFFNGGENREKFLSIFNHEELKKRFVEFNLNNTTIYGEAYGGKQQGMRDTYGKETRFVAFDVKIGDIWLSVSDAEKVVKNLGLEFVYYVRISTDLKVIDAERDAPSVQAKRNGILEDKKREGVVLRPIIELRKNNGSRIICKHKRDDFRETKSRRKITDPEKLKVLKKADVIADEWVTPMRLSHVLQKFPEDVNIEKTGVIIDAMIEDIEREAKGEIVESNAARRAISKKTAQLFKRNLKNRIG